jgi:isopenicillin-N N-acyltransferase like protein
MLFRSRRFRRIASVLLVLAALPFALHLVIRWSTGLTPPPVKLPAERTVQAKDGIRHFRGSYAVRQGKIWQVGLVGDSTEIGYAQARLMYDSMVKNEGILLDKFETFVPNSLFRGVLTDLARLRFREVDRGMADARRLEIAASAAAFEPDPYAGVFPTFQRMAYLNALYDMALSFEESPLIGCTTFLSNRAADGAPLLARAFDFEVDSIFDEDKAVFLVQEDGQIPFASVAWPGLVGVVSGMNLEGLAVVVHGARAGEVRAKGEPVVHALRRVLSTARTLDQAVAALKAGEPMVSHVVIVMDASGQAAAVERIPGEPPFVHRLEGRQVVTNHLLGPGAEDPKNQRVRERTTTLARYRRGAQLVLRAPAPFDARVAVSLLRDRKALNDKPLELGDRRAIDALIATHGVVMNTRDKVLWVSESPHLLGRFVAFRLPELFAPGYVPRADEARDSVPADPFATSDEYQRFLSAHPR